MQYLEYVIREYDDYIITLYYDYSSHKCDNRDIIKSSQQIEEIMKIKLDAFCMDAEFIELLKKELNVTVLNPDNSSPFGYEFEGTKENLTTMVEVHWNMTVEDSDFYN